MVAVIGASESERVERDIAHLGGEKAKRACPCYLPAFAEFTVCGTMPFSESSETEAYHCRATCSWTLPAIWQTMHALNMY